MSISEHITGLTVTGFWYLFAGNELGAETCWKTAADLVNWSGIFIRTGTPLIGVA